MKKLATISLFIFTVVLISILTAGLVFYQNNKGNGNQIAGSKVDVLTQTKINQIASTGKSLVLNMAELVKHNKSSDCWMLISGSVYDITSFFGSHPGGNATMEATCGTDATVAYATRDPYAKTSGTKINHSKSAQGMLTDYYLGKSNETIGQQVVTNAKAVVAPKTITAGDGEDDD